MKENKESLPENIPIPANDEKKLKHSEVVEMCEALSRAVGGNPPYPAELTDAIHMFRLIEGRFLVIEVRLRALADE